MKLAYSCLCADRSRTSMSKPPRSSVCCGSSPPSFRLKTQRCTVRCTWLLPAIMGDRRQMDRFDRALDSALLRRPQPLEGVATAPDVHWRSTAPASTSGHASVHWHSRSCTRRYHSRLLRGLRYVQRLSQQRIPRDSPYEAAMSPTCSWICLNFTNGETEDETMHKNRSLRDIRQSIAHDSCPSRIAAPVHTIRPVHRLCSHSRPKGAVAQRPPSCFHLPG